MSTKMSLNFVRASIESLDDSFREFEHNVNELYARKVSTHWQYRHERPDKKDVITQPKRLYIYFYYNIERAAEEEKRLDKQLISLRQELLDERPIKAHEALYAKYFTETHTPKRGVHVSVKTDVVAKQKRYYGFFALISNEKMSAREALQHYRNKDVVEKAFGNLKERLNQRRLLVSSEHALEGKLFVAFIDLLITHKKADANSRAV
jgi:hypothetical protein